MVLFIQASYNLDLEELQQEINLTLSDIQFDTFCQSIWHLTFKHLADSCKAVVEYAEKL